MVKIIRKKTFKPGDIVYWVGHLGNGRYVVKYGMVYEHFSDAVVVDLAVAQNYVKEQGFVMLDESLLDEKNYIIAKEGNDEMIDMINKCIDKFLASDDYKTLCEKYGLKQLEN